MDNVTLKLEKRDFTGGRKADRLRKSGYIPAVVYGKGMEPVSTQVKTADLKQFLSKHGKNSVFMTEFAEENNFSALIKEVQYNVFGSEILNINFQKVSLDEKIHVEVPIRVTGWERIERNGSVVVHQLNEVEVECLPRNVPHHIDIDVSTLTPGHSLTAGQLPLPEGVALSTQPTDVVLSITAGKAHLQAAEPEGQEQFVPETAHWEG